MSALLKCVAPAARADITTFQNRTFLASSKYIGDSVKVAH